jgi:hypothetical protein
LFLALDALVLGPAGPWESLLEPTRGRWRHLEVGTLRDQLALQKARRVPPERARAVVVGSSRADEGFRPSAVPIPAPASFARLTHAFIDPFVMRSFVAELCACEFDVVVLVLSELDTHRPLALVPPAVGGDLSALRDLLALAGPDYAWENRHRLYRTTLASTVRSYRFRPALQYAGLDRLRRFDFGSSPGDEPESLKRRRARAIVVAALEEMTLGPHVAVQEGLVRETVERLVRCGADVVLFETPLSPRALVSQGPAMRESFVRLSEELARGPAVHYVALEATGPYLTRDFADLIHLSRRKGASKMTRGIYDAVRRALARRARETSPGDTPRELVAPRR